MTEGLKLRRTISAAIMRPICSSIIIMGAVGVIELDRKYLRIMMEAGYVLIGMRRFDDAKKIFEGLSLLSPESEIPIVALGGVSFCEGDFQKAILYYRKALKVDPQSFFAKVYLGEALLFSGKKQEGLDLLEEVKSIDERGPAGHFAQALLEAIEKGFVPKKDAHAKKLRSVH